MTRLWIGTGKRPDPNDPDIWKRITLLPRVQVDTSRWVVPGAEWANRPSYGHSDQRSPGSW